METVLHQEENEAKSMEEIEMLQMKISTMHLQRMEMDKKVQALPKDKNYQVGLNENDKLNEIKEILEKQLVLFQSENEDGKQLVAVIEKLAETNKAKETNEDTKHEQTTDGNEKLEQLMLSQNEHLIKREQKLIHLIEEMQNLQAQVEQLSNDEAHSKLEHMEKQNDILLKENEKLRIEVSMLRKQNPRKQKQDTNPIAFQDDIYGDIVIDHPLIIRIVKTRQFQRLKVIKNL
uniref:Uncharacterized protein n=1 Tax=Amphimedon queenslandica TaxID=400682 RepID=A0A1X7SIR7_AMPQE